MILDCKALVETSYYVTAQPEFQNGADQAHGATFSVAIGKLNTRSVLRVMADLFVTISTVNIDAIEDDVQGFISFRVSNNKKLQDLSASQEIGVKFLNLSIKSKKFDPIDLFFIKHEAVDIIEHSDKIDLNDNLYLHVRIKLISDEPVIITLEKDISKLTVSTTEANLENDKRKVP